MMPKPNHNFLIPIRIEGDLKFTVTLLQSKPQYVWKVEMLGNDNFVSFYLSVTATQTIHPSKPGQTRPVTTPASAGNPRTSTNTSAIRQALGIQVCVTYNMFLEYEMPPFPYWPPTGGSLQKNVWNKINTSNPLLAIKDSLFTLSYYSGTQRPQ